MVLIITNAKKNKNVQANIFKKPLEVPSNSITAILVENKY